MIVGNLPGIQPQVGHHCTTEVAAVALVKIQRRVDHRRCTTEAAVVAIAGH